MTDHEMVGHVEKLGHRPELDRARREPLVRRAVSLAMLGAALARVLAAGHTPGGDYLEYLQAADALQGHGSYSSVRYPPGFPAVLVPLDALGLPQWWASAGAALVLVGLIWWAAVRLAGHGAGMAAGLLCAMSPMVFRSGVLLMADAQGAALALGAFVAVLYGWWRLAGVLVGLSAWTRLGHAVFLVASPRRRMAIAGLAVIAPLAVFNLVVWGGISGYDTGQVSFELRFLWEPGVWNSLARPSHWTTVYIYPAILLGKLRLLVPLLPLPAALEMWRRREEPATRFAAGLVVLNIGLYLCYLWQSPRFVLTAAGIIIVYAAAWFGRVASDLLGRRDGEVVPSGVALAGSTAVV